MNSRYSGKKWHQETLVHEHVSTQGTLAWQHVCTQDTLVREHVNMQGTLARGTQFNRLKSLFQFKNVDLDSKILI